MNNLGIPTIYRHRNFRSRLEAKWAAFFDEVGWRWEYEPLDLNGWIPDFLLIGAQKVLVEVKPIVEFDIHGEIAAKITRALPTHESDDAMRCPKPLEYEVLVLGIQPFLGDAQAIGWLRDDGGCWGEAIIGRWLGNEGVRDGQIGFCHDSMSYADRITGRYDGGHYGDGVVSADEVDKFWANAINATQWRRGHPVSMGASR